MGMKKMNIRQLRDTKRLKTWLRTGQTVELRERDQVIARIVPAGKRPKAAKMPDFAAMRKEIIGDRVLPNMVIEEREKSRY
jgi:antitoxin (DNA-binding transcriptional repressor) of toxin-antitoxin stability system